MQDKDVTGSAIVTDIDLLCKFMSDSLEHRIYLSLTTLLLYIHFFPHYTQTLSGLTQEQASTDSFSNAVLKSVAVAVGVSSNDVSGTVDAAAARRLLADVNMIYNLGIFTNLTSSQTIDKLQSAVDSGAFLRSLRSFSGIDITSLANTRFNDETPTGAPTAIPTVLIVPEAQQGTD